MVRVKVPLVAPVVVLTVSVELPDVVMLVGLNVPLPPLPKPVTLNATLPVKPLTAPTVTVKVVDLPWRTDRDAGDAVIVKSATCTGLTTRVTVLLCVCVPSVPCTVSVNVPVVVVASVVMFNVEPLPGVMLLFVNVPVAPVGRPETLNVIGAVSPLSADVDTLYEVPLPTVTVCEDGVVLIEKSGTGGPL